MYLFYLSEGEGVVPTRSLTPLLDIHLSLLACGMALARGMRGLLIDFLTCTCI